MSSSSDHPWIYDVFINFRGKDTRAKFVSHLYAALSNAGINTFLDDENLQKGEELGATLKRAIEGSQIAIVVLSKYYVESSWCLNELVHIMECHKTYGQIVIPVFYYVDPSVVRSQRASFGDALIFTARKREALLSNWRGALTQVADLSGWDANKFRGTESKMLQLLVEDILKKLDISLLDITEYPIGLESRVQQITNFIDDQSSKVFVLIERSLVKVEKNNKLRMHDLLRDMGRAIVSESLVKEPAKQSRLWFHEDVLDVLSTNNVTETVEGLVLKSQRTGFCFNTDSFKEMKKLRLLQLDGVDLTGDYGYLSKQLRWVDWQRFTFNFIPVEFDQGNLVVFELKYSNVKQVWPETKLLQKLKILNVSHSKYLKNTPDFAKLPNLEKLIMKDCQSLSEVHSSIGDLKNLLLINFKNCTSLCNLPKEIYQLTSVKTLILSGCLKIDKLEEDILQMESLTTLIAANTGVKQVPFSIVSLKSIGYISLCGYEGLSHNVFPSIIRSWMSPTMNSLAHIPPFGGMSMSLVSLDIDSRNLGLVYQSPLLSSCSTLRSVLVQCDSEIQLKQEFRRFIDDLYGAGLAEVGASHDSQISDLSLRSLLFGIGSCHIAIDTLGKSLSQGLSDYDSRDSFLPGDNYPSWLAYKCKGPSVLLQVPENSDFSMKGITLFVIYSSTHENLAAECLPSVLIINYRKFTIQIYKRDTVRSFNDEDWQGVVSNLEVGDNVEIFVAIGHGFTVKETAVYLVYDQANAMEIDPSNTMEVDPSTDTKIEPLREVELQPSPYVKTESSAEEEEQLSPDVQTEPSAEEYEPSSEEDVQTEPSVEDYEPSSVEDELSPDVRRKSSADAEEYEPSSEEDVQTKPSYVEDELSPEVRRKSSAEEEVQPSPYVKMEQSLVDKNEPFPKRKRKIFTRFAKRVGECLCLDQN
ncbi:disease resistance protein RUN1 [Trifolium repens]|nr:disease resistance protein RUN1 [Trifolium repens]